MTHYRLHDSRILLLVHQERGQTVASKIGETKPRDFVSLFAVELAIALNEDFDLHKSNHVVDVFWRQLEWIRPESYIADTHHLLTFVTTNSIVFAAVRQALSESGS